MQVSKFLKFLTFPNFRHLTGFYETTASTNKTCIISVKIRFLFAFQRYFLKKHNTAGAHLIN